jgi:hypothetical protein
MWLHRSVVTLIPAVLTITSHAGAAPSLREPAVREPARAPVAARTLFTWNGTVDREVLLVIRGRSVETRANGIDASFPARVDGRDDLPRELGDVQVHIADGRGSVEVVQQPTPRNDFTAIVRVVDPRSGADRYRVIASWQPVPMLDPRDRDRDGDRDRIDDWNRGRGRDDRNDRGRDDSDRGSNDRKGDRYDDRGRDAGRLSWRGAVDDVAEIRIQGRRVEFRSRTGQLLRDVRYDVRGTGLPRRSVMLELAVDRGRGTVEVVQEPNRFNDYAAIIRVIDRRSGYGQYDFDLRWY